MKYRLEFKHGFTDRGCLQSAILKISYDIQEKRVKGYAIFPSKCSK